MKINRSNFERSFCFCIWIFGCHSSLSTLFLQKSGDIANITCGILGAKVAQGKKGSGSGHIGVPGFLGSRLSFVWEKFRWPPISAHTVCIALTWKRNQCRAFTSTSLHLFFYLQFFFFFGCRCVGKFFNFNCTLCVVVPKFKQSISHRGAPAHLQNPAQPRRVGGGGSKKQVGWEDSLSKGGTHTKLAQFASAYRERLSMKIPGSISSS